MTGQGGMDKWMEHELANINKALVTRRRSLRELLDEADPRCETKEGDEYRFSKESLKRFARVLSHGEDVLLPVSLCFSSTLEDSCYVSDETASIMLRRLEAFGEAYPYRDGKMWLPNSLAFSILQKYPTIFQSMFL